MCTESKVRLSWWCNVMSEEKQIQVRKLQCVCACRLGGCLLTLTKSVNPESFSYASGVINASRLHRILSSV